MPHYSIHHTCPLTTRQCQALATEITKLHCATFDAPSAFVNVTVHRVFREDDVPSNSNAGDVTHFVAVGGKKAWTNYITGHLRPRPASDRKIFDKLAQDIMNIWNTYARPEDNNGSSLQTSNTNTPLKEPHGRLDDPRALHNIFIMTDIVAAFEQGLLVPVAGNDRKWMEERVGEFEKRARDGDESMGRLAEEVRRGSKL